MKKSKVKTNRVNLLAINRSHDRLLVFEILFFYNKLLLIFQLLQLKSFLLKISILLDEFVFYLIKS